MIGLLVVFFFLVWAGATLLIDAGLRRRQRYDLTARLLPYQSRSLADQAQRWLQDR